MPLPQAGCGCGRGPPREVFAVFGGVLEQGRWGPQPGHLRCCCPGRVFSGSLRWRARVPCSPPAPPGWGTAWAVLWGTARVALVGGVPSLQPPHTHIWEPPRTRSQQLAQGAWREPPRDEPKGRNPQTPSPTPAPSCGGVSAEPPARGGRPPNPKSPSTPGADRSPRYQRGASASP